MESGGEVALLDPLAPPGEAREFWERLDAKPPTVVAILKPDHVRDVDRFVERYGARAFGPRAFFPTDIPRTELEPIYRGETLPGGLVAVDDGRGQSETPLYLPEQRTLVFADGLTAPDGELRVWAVALARAAHAAGAARVARAAVRARDRLPRRSGARSRRVRAGARAAALARTGIARPMSSRRPLRL